MLDGRYRFDNFVVGVSNRLAVSAARAVAEAPGSTYNPLFLYSESGLGKTHLLAAIGYHARTLNPGCRVEYLAVDELVERLNAAVEMGQAGRFVQRFGGVQVLLLDDVQALSGRAETQSELLRLFNALQQDGRQVVMASDRPPQDIADVDSRLLTRMAGGLIVDIGPPEYETRVAILRAKCAERGLAFGAGVLEELARVPTRNVRELQGWLNRLVAQQSLSATPLEAIDVRGLISRSRGSTPVANEFDSFVREITAVVSQSVDRWRTRLGEFIARWAGEGIRTTFLERFLDGQEAPDLDKLEADFLAAVHRLRWLEQEATRLDPKLAGLDVFRDPERLGEAEGVVLRAMAALDPPLAPRPELTVDSLVAGSANQLALKAAAEVIAFPGERYNPLYIHGPKGCGKTHLAHALGNALRARLGDVFTVACIRASEMTEEVIKALQAGDLERWRMRYRAADALVIDDVQDLAGKERTQDELFHLFNAMLRDGKQVVLTADAPPSDLFDIAARLKTRFEGGLVVEMGRVSEAERIAQRTPVPEGAEAAAPTIDFWDDSLAASSLEAAPSALLAVDREKLIFDWASLDGRVLEELR
jgi:chromosomal replication initiator protein